MEISKIFSSKQASGTLGFTLQWLVINTFVNYPCPDIVMGLIYVVTVLYVLCQTLCFMRYGMDAIKSVTKFDSIFSYINYALLIIAVCTLIWGSNSQKLILLDASMVILITGLLYIAILGAKE